MFVIQDAPSPWTLKGHSYFFPIIVSPFSTSPIPLPKAALAPLEEQSTAGETWNKTFHGGVGGVVVVRYDESPVGPYDELIYCPGLFSYSAPPTENGQDRPPPQYLMAITRIYVSTLNSVVNGRRNWNIPKHLASFNFEALSSRKTLMTVYPMTAGSPSAESATASGSRDADTSSERPFFKAILRDSILPPIYSNTNWLNTSLSKYILQGRTFDFFQPDLPPFPIPGTAAEQPSKSTSPKSTDEEALVSRGRQGLFVQPRAKGWAKLAYMVPVQEGKASEGPSSTENRWASFGDSEGFPAFRHFVTGKTGMRVDFSEMVFPVAEVAP
ncbi:hypothetical protein T439DRAFT_327222 [Meredithblackwellia eburnea MCA 4105]